MVGLFLLLLFFMILAKRPRSDLALFISFLSVYIYIVHYQCFISPHGLAALEGDIKID